MKGLAWLLVLCAGAVALALAAHYNEGYALLVVPPYRIEVSLNFLIVAAVIGFLALHGLLRGIAHVVALPAQVRAWRARRAREKGERALSDAWRLFFEGRYGQALRRAEAAHGQSGIAAPAALLAARAAHAMRDADTAQSWLQKLDSDEQFGQARLMVEAEQLIDRRDFEAALDVLGRLRAGGGTHLAGLRLELRAQQGVENWGEVLRLARQLEKRGALLPEPAASIKDRAHAALLETLSADAAGVKRYWDGMPSGERDARVAAAVASMLLSQGDCAAAAQVIEKQLAETWDDTLINLYSTCTENVCGGEDNRGDGILRRIARAEEWLRTRPKNAMLLLALGRLCLAQQLWGKAQSYFEASISVADSRAAHIELAHLFESQERVEEANRHYRLAVNTLNYLP